jgi:hypothetical protein
MQVFGGGMWGGGACPPCSSVPVDERINRELGFALYGKRQTPGKEKNSVSGNKK